jgi:hypothetical protein
VRRFTGPGVPGVHQVEWGMDRAGVRRPAQDAPDDPDSAREPGGPLALPGDYVVRVSLGGDTVETTLRVLPDPRVPYDEATARRTIALQDRLLDAQHRATAAADRLRDARETLERVRDIVDGRDGASIDSLGARGDRVEAALDTLYLAVEGEEIQGFRSEPDRMTSRLGTASGELGSGRWAEPSEAALRALDRAEASVDAFVADVDAFFASTWAEYRAAVEAANLDIFGPGS